MARRMRLSRKSLEFISGIKSKEELFAKFDMQYNAVKYLMDDRRNKRTFRFNKALYDSFNMFIALASEIDAVFKQEYEDFKKERLGQRIGKPDSDTSDE